MSSLFRSNGHRVGAPRISTTVLAAAMLCLLLAPVRAVASSGEVRCCSTDSSGVPGNSYSLYGYLTPDGRYAAFFSHATNLVDGDTNGLGDAFRKDLATGQTVRCSTDSSGTQSTDGISYASAISADGRYVAFYSNGTALVSGDTNGFNDVFRKDLATNQTVRCSTDSSGTEATGGDSLYASISADGRYVFFESDAKNLVGSDTNGMTDIFRKDVVTGETIRCSTRSDGGQAAGISERPSGTPDGRYVQFASYAENLVDDDTNGLQDVFVKDLLTNQVVRCSTDSYGTQAVGGNSTAGAMSPDGRYALLSSSATNLVTGDSNGQVDAFRKDLTTGEMARCSTDASGGQAAGGGSWALVTSADNRYVAIFSGASNLLGPGVDTNLVNDMFRKDMLTGEVTRCSTGPAGEQANMGSTGTSMDAEGKYAGFYSDATNLLGPGVDTNGKRDSFRKELPLPTPAIGSLSRVSGSAGTQVTINGTDFRSLQFNSYVAFGSVPVTEYTAWSDGQIKVKVPTSVSGKPAVTVVTGGGASGGVAFSVPPKVDSISPERGGEGAALTLNGSAFGSSRGSSAVYFDSTKASSYSFWSDGRITCKVPGGLSGEVEVKVKTSGGTSNPKTFDATLTTWYLAEGTTAWGFSTCISIQNPNDEDIEVDVTYMPSGKPPVEETITVLEESQATITDNHLRGLLGECDFSTRIACIDERSIAVDRTMSWTGEGAPSAEAHNSIGVTSPSDTWYLPEGSSAWGFETWLLIQNPNSAEATCNVTYMIEGDGPQTFTKKVPANSRESYSMEADIGKKDASIKVGSNLPVIPERAMYRNNRREGHDSIGTTTPSENYYLAEGTTAWGFTTYVLVQNPGAAETSVNLTYMTSEGPVPHPENPITMPANSRKTVRVNDYLEGKDFSTRVEGGSPIIAERAMYWGEGNTLGEACHDSIGLASPHKTFYLPDGQTGGGYETYTLIQNPGSSDVNVEVTYLTPSGDGNVSKNETIGAGSRRTFELGEHSGLSGRASIMVRCTTSGREIMCERAMYWSGRGAGTDTIGGYSD